MNTLDHRVDRGHAQRSARAHHGGVVADAAHDPRPPAHPGQRGGDRVDQRALHVLGDFLRPGAFFAPAYFELAVAVDDPRAV